MPNIHIHTDDAAITAAIVAYCMSIDLGRLRLTIDNSDRYDINGSLTNRVAGETGHRVVETVMRADMELAAERAIARQERQAVMESEYLHNRSVTCPYCQAEPTQPCAKPDGSYHPRPYVHSLRRGEANRVAVDGTHAERRAQRDAMRIDQRQDKAAARAATKLMAVITEDSIRAVDVNNGMIACPVGSPELQAKVGSVHWAPAPGNTGDSIDGTVTVCFEHGGEWSGPAETPWYDMTPSYSDQPFQPVTLDEM